MSLVKWIFVGLLLLPAAEIAVFVLFAMLIGWLWTILLFLATSAVGIWLLRRSGRDNLDRSDTADSGEAGRNRALTWKAPALPRSSEESCW
jgi:UPF0716 protein FxsA